MPEHQDSNEQGIREFAYQLWEEEGRPQGRELEIWLEAEARLRVRNNIPYPITFCDFSVKIPRTLATPKLTQVNCPTPEPGYITVSSSRSGPVPGATAGPLETLAHDSRVVLVELTTATALLDRIARLAEWVANRPGAVFFLESDPSSGELRLTLPYVRALLDPATHETMVGELDSAISNLRYANFVSFDITSISLESPVKLEGVVKGLSSMGAAAYMSVCSFFGSFSGQVAADMIKPVETAAIEFVQRSVESEQEHQKAMERFLAAEMTEKQNHDRVRVMQNCLSILGYNPGPDDGRWGPNTETTLKEFCKNEHVPYDGPHGKAAITQLAHAAAAKARPHGMWNQLVHRQ